MPPSLADRVRHILEAIGEIDRALAGKSYDEFAADRLLRAAIERFLEMISEASRYVPDDAKATENAIDWQRMADFGSRLRHAYHSVDPRIVWQIAKTDLEPLKRFIEQIVRD
jgi:uncharacterized protein with HEPN domain